MTSTSDPPPPGETEEEQRRAGIDAWRERRYGAARKQSAKLTPSQIDDRLNLMGCDHILRDEIVERLARLEACEAALRPFAEIGREMIAAGAGDLLHGSFPTRYFARAAELVPEQNT
jgi:hypothetical protein